MPQKRPLGYQCQKCLTVYYDKVVDKKFGIKPNTKFKDVLKGIKLTTQ